MVALPTTGSNTRKHHYIPVGYLKRFAAPESRNGQFYCIDKINQRQFRTSPNDSCQQRDFNRVDIPNVHPNALEDILGKTIEADFAKALDYVQKQHSLPKAPSTYFDTIMMVIALLVSRTPTSRKQREDFDNNLEHALLEMAVSTPEHWTHLTQKMEKTGYNLPQGVRYEEIRSSIINKEYERTIPHGYHIPTELDSILTLFPYLAERKWQLFIAPKGEDFICSDRPVILVPCKPEMLGKPIGFGLPSTIVLFPLSPRLCLTGAYEQKAQTVRVTPYAVAEINGFIVRHAHRFIYSRKEGFSYYDSKGNLKTQADLLATQQA